MCREHPGLINSRSCAAASWLTTLLSTCSKFDNLYVRTVQRFQKIICNQVNFTVDNLLTKVIVELCLLLDPFALVSRFILVYNCSLRGYQRPVY